jgi:hypothetical protein
MASGNEPATRTDIDRDDVIIGRIRSDRSHLEFGWRLHLRKCSGCRDDHYYASKQWDSACRSPLTHILLRIARSSTP